MKQQQILFFACYILFISFCSAQEIDKDPYNFNFTLRKEMKWIAESSPQALTFDTAQTVNGKHPMIFRKGYHKSTKWNTLSISQRIILPYTVTDSIRISIRNNCGYITKGMFYVFRYNDKEELISKDSLNINADGWHTHTLKLSSSPTRIFRLNFLVEAISTGLREKYQDPAFVQYLTLDKMEIEIGGRDIATLGTPALENLSNPVMLNPDKMISYEEWTNKLVKPFKGKKIVALGETIHHNDEVSKVAFDVIKSQIQSSNCRMVLLELPCNYGFMFNYYVSGGKVTPVFMDMFKKNLSFYSSQFFAFTNWLREYNKDKKRKVLLLCMDEFLDFDFFPELEVLDASITSLSEREVLTKLLFYIARNNFIQAEKEAIKQQGLLIKLLGKENFELFSYILHFSGEKRDSSNTVFQKYLNESESRFLQRDSTMYTITNRYLTTYLKKAETACIYSHYLHLAKNTSLYPWLPLGYYLKKQYGSAYHPVAILVGNGSSTMSLREYEFKKFTLTKPSRNSVEDAAAKLSDKCFYYPLDSKNYPLSFMRDIGSMVRDVTNYNQFELVSPKSVADGFIYIPVGRPIFDSDSVNLEDNYWDLTRRRLLFTDIGLQLK